MAENITQVNDQNFDTEITQNNLPSLIDFWAQWCAPCKAIAPHMEAVAQKFAGKIKVAKLNIDDSPQTASKFGIRSIPTLLFFKDGNPIDQTVGAVSQANIEEMINRHL